MEQKPARRLLGRFFPSDVVAFVVGVVLMALVLLNQASLVSLGHWFFHVVCQF